MYARIDDQDELKKESENVKELLGQVKKATSDLEASFETMVIKAFGMDETAASIQEASWKIKWTLDRIDLALERMNNTKYMVQLDDKSALTVNDLHRELLSNQKLALEEYKLEQKELFSQYKKDLKSIAAGKASGFLPKPWLWHWLYSNFCWLWLASWYIIGRRRSSYREFLFTNS